MSFLIVARPEVESRVGRAGARNKKAPPERGTRRGLSAKQLVHQPVDGAGYTVLRQRLTDATAGGDEVEVGGEGNGGRHALGVLVAHGQDGLKPGEERVRVLGGR